jgi:primosomal protein N' (replication factor Y)
MARLLATASPPRLVRDLPAPASTRPPTPAPDRRDELVEAALSDGRAVLRLSPGAPRWPVVRAASRLVGPGSVLVLTPTLAWAERVASQLRREGVPTASVPEEWAQAAAGGRAVVGARAAAWAPAPDLQAVVVLDGHDEGYKEERAPAWNAWQVAAERAERAGCPCVITSPCPTLELLGWGRLLSEPRSVEREGWPPVEILDRRSDDPRQGLFSERLVQLVRSEHISPDRPLVCILNRKGRARLLACSACGGVLGCETCGAAMTQDRDAGRLRCLRCGGERPVVCEHCGGQRLSLLRLGVARVAEELEALAGRPVRELTGDDLGSGTPAPRSPADLIVGTEAALHRLGAAGAVVFLDFDQELLAPRFRAAEQAMALLCLAGRLVGGRRGRVVVQTRLPDNEVLQAAVHADPARLSAAENDRRAALRLPPHSAMAVLSGPGAGAFAGELTRLGRAEVLTVGDGYWVRAETASELCDLLAAAERPPERLRIEVDPLRI